MKCHGISGIPGSKALTKKGNRLGLVPRLRAVWELTITHGDACILSSFTGVKRIEASVARIVREDLFVRVYHHGGR